jgi:predicted TPR repeat methyltransferase
MNINLLQIALNYHQTGNLEQAEKVYQQILEMNPDDANVLHLYGILSGQLGKYDQAFALISQGLELEPNNSTFHNSMGNVLWGMEKFADAIKHYETAITLQPNAPISQNNLGNLFLKLEQYEKAIQHYQAAIALKSDYAEAYYNLGLTFSKLNKQEEAIKNFQKALKLEPSYAKAHGQLALLFQQSNQLDEALEQYQHQLRLDPNDVESIVNLGAIFVKKGDLLQGVDYFHKALELQPNHHEGHYNLGSTYLSLQRPDEALMHYLRCLNDKPDAETYFNVGAIYMYKDRHQDAIDYFNSALAINPDFVAAHINLATTYLKTENHSKAIEHYKKALELEPDNPEISFILSAISDQKNKPTTAPLSFVKDLFDQYAPYYEKHLVTVLKYQAHILLEDTLADLLKEDFRNLSIVDLGCGTGLCGPLLKPHARKLIGIDIAPKMVAAARSKNVYDEVLEGDAVTLLHTMHDINLIVAADVFGYIGDLTAVFQAACQALTQPGWFAFTIEQSQDDSFSLSKTTRFEHSKHYIHQLSELNHFRILVENEVELRIQRQIPVTGILYILSK